MTTVLRDPTRDAPHEPGVLVHARILEVRIQQVPVEDEHLGLQHREILVEEGIVEAELHEDQQGIPFPSKQTRQLMSMSALPPCAVGRSTRFPFPPDFHQQSRRAPRAPARDSPAPRAPRQQPRRAP